MRRLIASLSIAASVLLAAPALADDAPAKDAKNAKKKNYELIFLAIASSNVAFKALVSICARISPCRTS